MAAKLSGFRTPLLASTLFFLFLWLRSVNHQGSARIIPWVPGGEIAFFLLKVAALEAVQRLSGAGVHLYGRLLRHFNVFAIHHSYGFGDGHPLGYWSKVHRKSQDHYCFSPSHQLSLFISKKTIHTQPHCESSSRPSTSDMRNCDESPKDALSGSWLVQLFRELEKQGITLPERVDEDELHRFYTAANGDISCLLSSLKRTICWRETYHILSSQELEMWSQLVFWHGFDVFLK
ncbi:uncharacterized protein [Elaeis guineensis]|uniref:uncharacterized protein isoform X2 n=1 Tax=Elaeis guineensis var. tenera TaxID=51953 RepID=UPI003C6CDD74